MKKRINTSAKGARLERKAISIMKEKGFYCTRSAASKGIFDIICLKEDEIVCIQVKCNSMPGSEEMNNIANLKLPDVCKKLVFVFYDGKPNAPEIIEV